MKKTVRVRFAPSPTGALHIGGVRTALYNFLFARKHGGQMLLRIEDTDSTRYVPGAEQYITEALHWLGIEIDEGICFDAPEGKGPLGPYRQTLRRDIYRKYVKQLIDSGNAYYAFDTPEELEAKRKEIPNFQYDATTRNSMNNSLTLSAEEVQQKIANGEKYVVRFKVIPNEEIRVQDIIRGEVVFNSSIMDDKVLYKSADDLPTYHLAHLVDDHLMEITHVIRGEEWLPSVPLHVMLYRAFGWESPQFAHLPLLLKPEGNGKLSKRDGDRLGFPVFPLEFHNPIDNTVSSGYREQGYFPEAIINFLALLGWHPSDEQEIFSKEELIQAFSLERVSKSGAKFDYEKIRWFNHHYLNEKSDEELYQLFRPILETKVDNISLTKEQILQAIALTKSRCTFVADLWEQTDFFFVPPTDYDAKSLKKHWKEGSHQMMVELLEILQQSTWESEVLNQTVMDWIAQKSYPMGQVMNSFRIALVGSARGPHIWEITALLGKEQTLARLQKALKDIAQ